MVNFTLVISVLHCGGLDSCYINLLSRWDFQQLCSYLISKASETKKMSHLETSLYQRLAQIQYTSMGLFILNRVSREWTWIDLHWHGIAFRECSGTYAECHEGKKEKKKLFSCDSIAESILKDSSSCMTVVLWNVVVQPDLFQLLQGGKKEKVCKSQTCLSDYIILSLTLPPRWEGYYSNCLG